MRRVGARWRRGLGGKLPWTIESGVCDFQFFSEAGVTGGRYGGGGEGHGLKGCTWREVLLFLLLFPCR